MKREKQHINAEQRIWIFIAYREDGLPFFSKLFDNHTNLKQFSANHSAEWKDKCKKYSSTYLDLFDQTLLTQKNKLPCNDDSFNRERDTQSNGTISN